MASHCPSVWTWTWRVARHPLEGWLGVKLNDGMTGRKACVWVCVCVWGGGSLSSPWVEEGGPLVNTVSSFCVTLYPSVPSHPPKKPSDLDKDRSELALSSWIHQFHPISLRTFHIFLNFHLYNIYIYIIFIQIYRTQNLEILFTWKKHLKAETPKPTPPLAWKEK